LKFYTEDPYGIQLRQIRRGQLVAMELAFTKETKQRLDRLVESLHCPPSTIIGDALSLYENALRLSITEPPK
jgi:predicted transcriptional regulator